MTYRKLTEQEIKLLEANNCRCTDWGRVEVADPFRPEHYCRAVLTGDIRLGTTEQVHSRCGGAITIPSGVYDATLHNVSVGNDVLINRIGNFIVNYDIGDGAVIESTARLVVNGETTFGQGSEASVLNETGGREVPIFDRLSAHVAYMIAMYRHDKELVEDLRALVDKYVETRRGTRGTVGAHACIVNSGTIIDVYVGPYAQINGATKLVNGSLMSEKEDIVYVGANVMATNFIFQAGSVVDEGAVCVNTYVGQATHLTRLFSAHDSLFFANCACENGEACAVFAGPYTVTMHKSSLLIAGMFSFLNAGSGSNQSNHMYKLGPIHQGVADRGAKTTSDSYMLWPAHVGAFSLVMGRHVTHPDTSDLPFSYLIEKAGVSHLVPGVNLKSVGTIRDAQKWPRRDRRKTLRPLDCINFNLLSPYTVQKMMSGIELLDGIEAASGATSESYSYQGMTLTASALRKGRDYYRLAIDKFMGNSIVKRLEGGPITSGEDLRRRLRPTAPAGAGEWVDLAGLIVPRSELRRLIAEVKAGQLESVEAVDERLAQLHAQYYDMEWTWVCANFARWWGKEIDALTVSDVRRIVERWQQSVVTLDKMLYEDARKEFSAVARIGFGMDSSREDGADDDFGSVRGYFDRDPFVRMVLDHIDKKTALAQELLGRLR